MFGTVYIHVNFSKKVLSVTLCDGSKIVPITVCDGYLSRSMLICFRVCHCLWWSHLISVGVEEAPLYASTLLSDVFDKTIEQVALEKKNSHSNPKWKNDLQRCKCIRHLRSKLRYWRLVKLNSKILKLASKSWVRRMLLFFAWLK